MKTAFMRIPASRNAEKIPLNFPNLKIGYIYIKATSRNRSSAGEYNKSLQQCPISSAVL